MTDFIVLSVLIAVACLVLWALAEGVAALLHFFRINARPVDDQGAMGCME